jgi:hypothetical protein
MVMMMVGSLQRIILLVTLTLALGEAAQSQEKLYSVAVKGNFTISSRLFHNIDAPNEFTRSQYISIDNIFGFGVDIRRAIDDTRLEVGIAAEYLRAKQKSRTNPSVEEGYWTVPVELTGYFVIPFSSDRARLYIGGGLGMYFGERERTVGNQRSSVIASEPGVGIHVLTGFGYSFTDWFALRSELKFRDIQFESTILGDNNEPSRARINVDGMVLDAGIVILF